MSRLAIKLIEKEKQEKTGKLDLGKCGLKTIPEELFELTWLEELSLSDRIGDYNKNVWIESKNSGESNFINIEKLPTEFKNLTRLKKLYFGGLYKGKWKLKICNILSNLVNLQTLALIYKQISDISFLENLTRLQTLDLTSNQIIDISFLEKLTRLQNLSLSDNKISDINFLEKLTGLQKLNLNNNQIRDISFLEKLTGLQNLYLSDNKIIDISFLEKLTGLQDLDLSYNQISDISFLEKLTGLQNLDLSSNKISKIPLSIFHLDMEINLNEFGDSGMLIYDNPIESPPMEILKRGRQSVLDWFKATKIQLNEIKIILIGDPKSGKTSLLRRFKDDTFDENEVQTDGVNIEDIQFGKCEPFKKQESLHKLTGHFWDFGGQEIMNATHQFFLTSRSVYVLVLDARKDANVSAQIRQWIKRIKATGGNSSIIIVANQIDVNTGFGFENEYELQKEFPQVKCFIKASCKTRENIDFIKDKLEELIPQAEFFNTEIDERWISLKDELQKETKPKHFLSEERFLEICNDCELNKKTEQKNAITFLHDLGIVLHFDKVKQYDYYVLDPYWITYGVYQILTSSHAGKSNGMVSMDKLEYIVNEEEDKRERYRPANFRKIQYTNQQSRFLVEILNQFKLCFCLPDHSHFIIPDLLDTNEPNKITEPIRKAEDSIHFVYEYEYLPKSFMPRIIVETHRIYSKIWRTGCVLQRNGCTALITYYQNRISIIVKGEHRKKLEFMSVIRFLIDSINQELSDKPNMLIPLPGVNAFADYEELLDRQKDGQKFFTLYKPEKKKFEISVLLEGVASQDEVREISHKIDVLLDKVDEIKNTLDSHYEYLINLPDNQKIKDNILDAIKEMNSQQSAEITAEIMQGIATAFDQSKEELDNRLTEIYTDLTKTEDVQLKLKLAVPLINLLGINLETEFDIKEWATKMYKRYEMKIFKLMGY